MISENIRRCRLQKGFTQKQLAELIGVQNYTIGDWERGRSEPCCDDLRILCVVLDVSADDLLDIETEVSRKNIFIKKTQY